MPMHAGGEFLYFLMVVVLWGWPVIAVVLWLAWRRSRLWLAVRSVLVLVPVAALVSQMLFRSGIGLQAIDYAQQQDEIANYLGDPTRSDVIHGGYVGTTTGGSMEYRRYQFPSLDGSLNHLLEIRLPAENVHGVATIDLVRGNAAVLMPARLIVWPPQISINPAMAPDEFFRRYYPAEEQYAFGSHTLIVAFRPRQSIIVSPPLDRKEPSWRWTDAILDL